MIARYAVVAGRIRQELTELDADFLLAALARANE
jgi:hypothetical protein